MSKKKKKKHQTQPHQSVGSEHISSTDPNGSYTGRPLNRFEKPVQDVDDL